jgi:hypothetical protein
MTFMLLVSDYDVIQGVDRVVIITASLAVIFEAAAIAFLIMLKRRSKESTEAKRVMLGIASFAALFGAGRFVMFIHDYFAANEFDTILYQIGNCLMLLGLFSLAFTIEKYIFPQTKKAISIIGLACVGLILVGYWLGIVMKVAVYTGTISQALLLFAVYVHAAKHSAGKVRTRALLVVFGLTLVLFGQFGGTLLFSFGLFDRVVSQLFSMGFTFGGLVLVSYGLVSSSDSKPDGK